MGSTGLTPGGFGLVEFTVAAALTARRPARLQAPWPPCWPTGWSTSGWSSRSAGSSCCGGTGPAGLTGSAPESPHVRACLCVTSSLKNIDLTNSQGARPSPPCRPCLELEQDPHAALARLRAQSPVAWVPALDGWLVTGYATGARGDAGQPDVHRRRPAVLHRPGGRPEHAVAGRARAQAATVTRSSPRSTGAARPSGCAAFAEAGGGRLVAAIRPAGAAELRREPGRAARGRGRRRGAGPGRRGPARDPASTTRIVAAVPARPGRPQPWARPRRTRPGRAAAPEPGGGVRAARARACSGDRRGPAGDSLLAAAAAGARAAATGGRLRTRRC